ncbi:MAG: hypothetical protein IKJ29_02685 [Akkermansia sp.]|nr:hypothetical protein [Akkermansia sp.]
MKIKPSCSMSGPLYPTLVAMVGAVLTGCDKQKVPGIVPFEQNPPPTENQQQIPGAVGCKPPVAPEQPIKQGGESIETPEILGGDVPYTPDMAEE